MVDVYVLMKKGKMPSSAGWETEWSETLKLRGDNKTSGEDSSRRLPSEVIA